MAELSAKLEQVYQNLTPVQKRKFDTNLDRNIQQAIDQTAHDAIRGVNDQEHANLVKEYKTAMYEKRGNPQALAAVRQSYREQGVDVDQVDFS